MLPPALVPRLSRLRFAVKPSRSLPGRGEVLRGRGGLSTDFADYRDYVAGDDLRSIDWNIMARLRRPVIKLFRVEQDRHLVLLVDCSASMAEGGKRERALAVATALAVVGLHGGEAVSVWAFGAGCTRLLPPQRGRQGLQRTLAACAAAPAAAGDTTVTDASRAVAARHLGRGAAIIVSDFHRGELRPTLDRLAATGLDPLAVQILAPAERVPEIPDDLRLVDGESGEELEVAATPATLAAYADALRARTRSLSDCCRARGGRLLDVDSGEPLEALLFSRMVKEGWMV